MTSTNLYQGYDIGRPTSKVMAPPGGASSNIFGVEPAAPKQQQKAQDFSNDTTSNRLFGGDAPEQSPIKHPAASDPKVASAPAGVNTHAGNSRNHDGDEEETEEERKKREEEEASKKAIQEASCPARAKPPRGAYNPITGEDYPDKIMNWKRPVAERTFDQEKPTQQAPVQRVRQPPGGQSSGPLW